MLRPGEVARLFGVSAETVGRWVRAGKLRAVRTPGGQLRFRESDVLPFLRHVDLGPEGSGGEP